MQIRRGERGIDVVRELSGLIDLRSPRRDLVLGERAHYLTQLPVLLGQVEGGEVSIGRERHGGILPCHKPIRGRGAGQHDG